MTFSVKKHDNVGIYEHMSRQKKRKQYSFFCLSKAVLQEILHYEMFFWEV